MLGYAKLDCLFQGAHTSVRLGIIRAIDATEPPLLRTLLTPNRIVGLTPVKCSMYPEASDFVSVLLALKKHDPLYGGKGYILTHMPSNEGFIRQPQGIEYRFDFETGVVRFPRRASRNLPNLIPTGHDIIVGYEGDGT